MNNLDKQYTDLVNDAYMNYLIEQEKAYKIKYNELSSNGFFEIDLDWQNLSQEEFINKIKTDDEFAKKRGVKVDVRELKLWERYEIRCKRRNFRNDWEQFYSTFGGYSDEMDSLKKSLNDDNIPTKVISFTYNNETIESYE